MDMFDLTGRVALVTGGGTGIGLAMATGLAGKGAYVILASRRRAVIEASAEDIRHSGGQAEGMVLDVTDTRMITEVFDRISKHHDRLDILINNAGWNRRMPCFDMDPEPWTLRRSRAGQATTRQDPSGAGGKARGAGGRCGVSRLIRFGLHDGPGPVH